MKDLPETRVRLPLALVLLFAVVHGALFVLACDDSSTTPGSSGSSGAQIAFTAQPGGTGNEGIFQMNASDGGGQTRHAWSGTGRGTRARGRAWSARLPRSATRA